MSHQVPREVEADTPLLIKNAIWAAKKAIFSARYVKREQLWAIKSQLLEEMQSAAPDNLLALGRNLNLGETMEDVPESSKLAFVQLPASDTKVPLYRSTKK